MAQNQIAGGLPWGNGGANQFMGLGGSAQQSMANLGSNYANSYQSALDMNRTGYDQILRGYQQTLGNNADARSAVGGGYDQLLSNVLGGIQGIGQSRQNDINAAYTQQSGALAQQLVNRGLGNSTVQGSMQRGVSYDQARASTDLANQLAQTSAGFQSQIGQAGLNYRGQAIQQNDADAQAQLQWMNSVNAQYPDAGMYSQLAQQFGAANQQEKDRNLAMGRGLSNPPPSGGGYVPSGGGMPPHQGGAGYGFGQPGAGSPMGSAYNLTGFAPANAGVVAGIGSKAYIPDSPDKGDGGYANPGESKGYGESVVGGYGDMPGYDTGYGGSGGGAGKGAGTGGGWGDIGAMIAGAGQGWGDYSWLS